MHSCAWATRSPPPPLFLLHLQCSGLVGGSLLSLQRCATLAKAGPPFTGSSLHARACTAPLMKHSAKQARGRQGGAGGSRCCCAACAALPPPRSMSLRPVPPPPSQRSSSRCWTSLSWPSCRPVGEGGPALQGMLGMAAASLPAVAAPGPPALSRVPSCLAAAALTCSSCGPTFADAHRVSCAVMQHVRSRGPHPQMRVRPQPSLQAGLLDQSPQRQGGLRCIEALLRQEGGISAAGGGSSKGGSSRSAEAPCPVYL